MISSIPKWVGGLFESALRPNMNVLETSYISPKIKKIRFSGDVSRMNFQLGYANVVRVSKTEFRNYTVAFHDRERGIADIICHIHGNGTGSQYMNSLGKGDELYLSSPRGKELYLPDTKQQIIFGDETSLGLACAFLPVLKQNHHQYHFCFELEEENKNVPGLLGLDNYTLFSKNSSFKNEDWIENLPLMETPDWHAANFVLTGNVKSVQTFRKVLKSRTSGKVFSQGYWLEGKKGL